MRCASYCTADSYNIDELAKYFRNEGFDPKFYGNVIHVHNGDDQEGGEIFCFHFGCVTFWGTTEEEENQYLEKLKAYEGSPLIHRTHDDSSTFELGDETAINEEEDKIILESDDVLVKLALSYGLSQSVKLAAFEASVDQTIENTRYLSAELAEKGKISLSRKKLAQGIGLLFTERNSINLHSDILDTPEFFWRRPRYEPYYHLASSYMDITTRLDILNRRLDVIHDLYEILSNELKHTHASFLEIVIIFLILWEVIMVIIKDFCKWV
ncbi:MAG: RMD1 family protein [Alphaproteobacteria bacterium]|nr:RMD1 family protein [Alphaproteobacteria bacterium]